MNVVYEHDLYIQLLSTSKMYTHCHTNIFCILQNLTNKIKKALNRYYNKNSTLSDNYLCFSIFNINLSNLEMNIKKYNVFQCLSLLQMINQTHNINIIKDNND